MDKPEQKLPALRNPVAFRAWLTNGRSISATAKEVRKSRATVTDWMKEQQWEAHAELATAKLADAMSEVLAVDGVEQYSKAKALAAKWLEFAKDLLDEARYEASSPSARDMKINTARLAFATALEMDSKLYNRNAKLQVEHSGSIELITPEEDEAINAALASRYEQPAEATA